MTRVGIIGYGKIARDQHVPSIAAIDGLEFAAASSRSPIPADDAGVQGLPIFTDHKTMLAEVELDAVSLCTPPGVRYALARDCIEAGKHVMLEKPPGVTLGEVEALARLATTRGVTLMTTWHAQANDAVVQAAELIATETREGGRIATMEIVWHEDVRKWHPGQAWIWEPGGFGVFDPGINALSIATRLIPAGLIVRDATLHVPANKAMPIAAELTLTSPAIDADIPVSFDFRRTEGERWTIEMVMASGSHISLTDGGAVLTVDGVRQDTRDKQEYPMLYAEFAELIAAGRSHVDLEPLRVVADAFMLGTRVQTEPFVD